MQGCLQNNVWQIQAAQRTFLVVDLLITVVVVGVVTAAAVVAARAGGRRGGRECWGAWGARAERGK